MLQAILFDLDGTLLPMDNDYFTKYYFKYLAKTAYPWGYTDPEALVKMIWTGVEAMVRNDGSRSNCEVFWDTFEQVSGKNVREDIPKFNAFYLNEFHNAKAATFPTPLAAEAVRIARRSAEHVILATNPIFPYEADVSRMEWAGIGEKDFDLITDYSNSCHSKPNPAYYQDILDQFGLDAEQCLMVGNDVREDMLTAEKVGIPSFIVTDYLINREDKEITCPHGSFADMLDYLRGL